MILVISEERDHSTVEVLRWIKYYGKSFFRINEEQDVFLSKIDSHDIELIIEEKVLKFSEIKSVWYRRGTFNLHAPTNIKDTDNNIPFIVMKDFMHSEKSALEIFLHYKLRAIGTKIGSFLTSHLNKLVVLEKARAVGLKVPDTLITSSKDILKKFHLHFSAGIINKTIGLMNGRVHNNEGWSLYTNLVEESDITEIFFFPSKFQENIEKKYEIRVFILGMNCYAMAIFSQSNKQTKIDFRKYDKNLPNRRVPFKLPCSMEEKLLKLSRKLKLNSCSIDLIVNKKNEFVFLEVNPIGQFGMVSHPCNYFLEEKIAKYLIN